MNLARFEVENHRGRRVPQVLGIAIAGCGAVVSVGFWGSMDAAQWGLAAGAGSVFAAGVIDDLAPVGPRGLRNHLRELMSGHMTTGILKLVVTMGAAVLAVALLDRGGGVARLAGVILVAGTTNIWNGLDVRPGRALKAFLVVTLLLGAVVARGGVVIVIALWPAALVALWFDVRERAMLGDAGANLLGFSIGAALAASLPTWAMGPAAVAVVALNVVAETVTFSRVIDATLPLRWFDRLGRIPD
jgi:hypothetical protein